MRGLHESIINHGRNRQLELLTATHEAIGGSIARGYFKACGRPMATLVQVIDHIQPAAMAVDNACMLRYGFRVLLDQDMQRIHVYLTSIAASPTFD